ncbi:5'-methylthioadenosine/adenosylhomocysteine nucleosidase [Mucilaginibacter sp. OK268]|uniref:5'-methylthioadenosine/adenosylhomocysteine nucleosidase n=1 Tax=Mucilaginibacter sp. OK268 TaxID=1881048 RepID=UPI000B808F96|nr:5'-methylthioadenosine/adenosylhomocysteine nucleosidase [Mucilaginibacter sp. OK268]
MNEKIIGIMGAMHEEINSILHLMAGIEEISYGRRTYYTGTINNIKTVVVFSRWGKVAAATTVTSLITKFNITDLIFIGVAGAINTELKIGDVVIGDRLVQHDMDARPLMPRHEIPLLGVTYFESDPNYITIAKKAIDAIVGDHVHSFIDEYEIERFLLRKTRVFTGTIASGDQFFAKQADKELLHAVLPDTLCVEMEGAAVAQVCYEYEIPFVVLRIISDECNENSSIDFPDFIQNVSSKYAYEIIKNMFALL